MKRMYATFALVFGLAAVVSAQPATLATFDLTAATMDSNVANADNGIIHWYGIIHRGGDLTVSTVDALTTLPDTEVGLYDSGGIFLGSSDHAVDSLSELTMDLVAGTYYAATGGFDVAFDEPFAVTSDDVDMGDIKLIASVVSTTGDFNGDGVVDEVDLNLVLDHWGVDSDGGIPDGWVNNFPVGVIGAGELSTVLSEWSDSGMPVAAPEPSSFVLVLLGLAVLARRRR